MVGDFEERTTEDLQNEVDFLMPASSQRSIIQKELDRRRDLLTHVRILAFQEASGDKKGRKLTNEVLVAEQAYRKAVFELTSYKEERATKAVRAKEGAEGWRI